MTTTWLAPLREALDAAEAPVDVFFRDDDAGWGDARLRELLDVFAAHGAPLDLAVIPAALDPALAGELRARRSASGGRLGLHQHGLAHANHQMEGRKCEFGPARRRAEQRADIAAGRDRLRALLGDVDPIFTPPWNRCTADTGSCLGELGFAAVSREARAAPLEVRGLRELPIRVDWFAHAHRVRVPVERLGELLADAARSGAPAGVMFHHALMDARDMRLTGELLRLVTRHPHARPLAMAALLESAAVA